MKTSKDIVIRLIDQKLISGEEAYVLLNDILQSEMLETYKALENKKNSDIFQNITTKSYLPNTITWNGDTGSVSTVCTYGLTSSTNV